MFAELAQMGAPMAYLDVGGGLAIDYDGSKTDTPASLSYSMQQYANDVVATIQVPTHVPAWCHSNPHNLGRTSVDCLETGHLQCTFGV